MTLSDASKRSLGSTERDANGRAPAGAQSPIAILFFGAAAAGYLLTAAEKANEVLGKWHLETLDSPRDDALVGPEADSSDTPWNQYFLEQLSVIESEKIKMKAERERFQSAIGEGTEPQSPDWSEQAREIRESFEAFGRDELGIDTSEDSRSAGSDVPGRDSESTGGGESKESKSGSGGGSKKIGGGTRVRKGDLN